MSARTLAGQGTIIFEARLLALNDTYNLDSSNVNQALIDAIGRGSTDLDPNLFKAGDPNSLVYSQALEPLSGRELHVYADTNGNGIVDVTDQEICPTPITTDANGVGSCEVPLQNIPSLQCTNYLVSFDPSTQTYVPPPTPPGTPPDLSTYEPSAATVEVCGDFLLPLGAFQNQLSTTCLPVFLLLGLLTAAMYAAGRNPMALLDMSTPRLPKPKPYGMRRITVATGGPMQRVFLNKQIWVSQRLFDVGTTRLVNELRRSSKVSDADIQYFIDKYKGKSMSGVVTDRAAIAAALRLLAAGHTRGDVERRLEDMKRQADASSKDNDERRLAYHNYLRRIIHIGDEGERGRFDAVTDQRRRLRLQSHFRSLHDAVWHEENAKRAIMASGAASGMSNWLKLKDLGDKLDAQNKGRTQWGYYLNILPRLADRGFVGALIAQRIAAIGKLNQLWNKNLREGIPVLFGFRRSKAEVGKAVEIVGEIESGMGGMFHSFERFMAMRRYQLSILNSADGRNRMQNLLKSGNPTIDDIDKVTIDETLRRLSNLKSKGLHDRDFERMYGDAKGLYEQLRRACLDYHMLKSEPEKISKLGEISRMAALLRAHIVEADKRMEGLLITQRTTNREKSDLIWEVVGKQKIWELGTFAMELGAISGDEFKRLVMGVRKRMVNGTEVDDVEEGDLAKRYNSYVRATSESERMKHQADLEHEVASKLFAPLRSKLEEMTGNEKAIAHVRLGNILGVGYDANDPSNAGRAKGDVARLLWMMEQASPSSSETRLQAMRRIHGGQLSGFEEELRQIDNALHREGLSDVEAVRLRQQKQSIEKERNAAYLRMLESMGLRFEPNVEQHERLAIAGGFSKLLPDGSLLDKLPTRSGASLGYTPAIGHLYSPDAEKLASIVKNQLAERWTTQELSRLVVTNKNQQALMDVLGLAALRLGINMYGTVPRLAGETDDAYQRRQMQQAAGQMSAKLQRGTLSKVEDEAVKAEAIGFLLNRRAHGGIDEMRQALVEGMGRENFTIGTEGLKPFLQYTGGGMLDLGDMHSRMERDVVIAQAMANTGIVSGGKVTAGQMGKGVWIVTPDQGIIPFDEAAMKDENGRVKFTVGGMDKVINGKLQVSQTGEAKLTESNAWYNQMGKRLDAYLLTVFEEFNQDQQTAKSILKYNKQTARTMEHGPIATLGIQTSGGSTGAFAGEYSELTERKMHLVDLLNEPQGLLRTNATLRLAQQKGAQGSEEVAEKIRKNEEEIRTAYRQIHDIEKEMRNADEVRYHDAFFRFARHFREIDDTLMAGKTQRALSSTWGSTAYTDMLYNFGLATPWTPWHGIRGRIPFGTAVAIAMQPGWMIGKYFAEKMRPYSLLGSNMPAYWETQEFGMRSQWKEAIKSTIPISPESFKFWHVTIPVFRNPKTYKAVETDADIWGTEGYKIMQELKSQKRALEDAMKATRDVEEKKRLEEEAKKQQKRIDDEFFMLQHGYFRQINEDGSLPNAATMMTDTYRSIYLTDKSVETDGPEKYLKMDKDGKLLAGEIERVGTDLDVDDKNMRILPPTLHRTIVGTIPVERLEDYFLDLGVIAAKVPGLAWLARLPIAPAYYDFDSFEPNEDRHGRAGFFGKHYAYHAQTGSVTGIAGFVSAIPGLGPIMAEALAYIPAPVGTDPSMWGAKTGSFNFAGKSVPLAGEYVEKGLTGSSQMWMKYLATYEQMPLYRMGEGAPVAGITYFSPYKYMDPNLVQAFSGKYKYLAEPHEAVTLYPHLADELTREMNITDLMLRRKQEMSMFQHMSMGQAGGMIPALGLLQTLPIALSVAGLSYEKVQKLRGWMTPQEHLYRKLSGSSQVQRDQHIITSGQIQTCPRCLMQARGGQQCMGCGTYVPYR